MFSVVGVNGVLVFGWQTEVVDLLSKVQWGRTDADQLETAIGQHLRLHQLAYKLVLWRPKHHWALHLPAVLDRMAH